MTKKIRSYSDEFKAEAVKKIADNNGTFSLSDVLITTFWYFAIAMPCVTKTVSQTVELC